MSLKLPLLEVRKRVGRSRRRGKYAAQSLARLLVKHGWNARLIPASGAGPVSEINYFPDVEATYIIPCTDPPVGIYLAAEVKSSIRGVCYLDRTLQLEKLFRSMNVFSLYQKRFAVLVAHFRKQWRFLLLGAYQTRFDFITIRLGDPFARTRGNRSIGKLFTSIDGLIDYMVKDRKIWFSVSSQPLSQPCPQLPHPQLPHPDPQPESHSPIPSEKPTQTRSLDPLEQAHKEYRENPGSGDNLVLRLIDEEYHHKNKIK